MGIYDLQGRVVIITGASSGIGRATALALAKSGAFITVVARRGDKLTELVMEVASTAGKCLPIVGDIRNEAFCESVVAQTVAHFGRVDVLINNAGVGHRSYVMEMTSEEINAIWDTNVVGLLAMTRAAVPHMKRQKGGQIVNISSVVGQRPLPTSAIYCASKTAVNFLSRSLRMELHPHRIKVTVVYPGLTATEFAEARFGQKGNTWRGLRGVAPEKVADAIVDAIRNELLEVYISFFDQAFVYLNRLFPRTLDWLLG